MAWSISFSGESYFDGNFRFTEDFTLSQVASTQAGYKRIKVNYSARVSDRYSGANTSYYVSSRSLGITYGGTRYSSETNCPGYYGSYSGTVYIQVPSAALGNAQMNGTICGANFTLGGAGAYTLSISKGTGVNSVTVSRTSSPVGSNGTLSSGAIVYVGDTLSVNASAEIGYELNPYPASVTVSGNTCISVTAKRSATARVYTNGSWQMHLVYIWASGAFRLHLPYVWTSGGWKLCS